jgi:hypothetical protein
MFGPQGEPIIFESRKSPDKPRNPEKQKDVPRVIIGPQGEVIVTPARKEK